MSKNKKILRPDKEKLNLKSIDSITIRQYDSVRLIPSGKPRPSPYYDTIKVQDFDSTRTKKLNAKEIKLFVKKWNTSKPRGMINLGKFYEYIVTIYSKSSERKIIVWNNCFIENEKWSYESKSDDFFKELWNNKK